MARKNLLVGLTEAKLPAGNSVSAEGTAGSALAPSQPVSTLPGARGAIGAVSRSLEQIKAQGVIEIEPNLIDPSMISDRLGSSPEDHAALVESIREHGQQVPILVRPHPEKSDRYQIAYGRRRLKALAEIGRKAKAIVRQMTDEQLFVAQGQENNARTDLTFIEKALFAARLEEAGVGRETIMASLSVDKSNLSRLVSAATKVPHDMIEAIGRAPSTGRDRWFELAGRLAASGAEDKARSVMETERFAGKQSDERFALIFSAVAPKAAKAAPPDFVRSADGTSLARVKDDERSLTLAIDRKGTGGFADYLLEQLPDLFAAFQKRERSSRNTSGGKD